MVQFYLRYITRKSELELGRCWWCHFCWERAAIITFLDVPAVNRAHSWCLLHVEPCETASQPLLGLATPHADGRTRRAKLLACTVLTQTNLRSVSPDSDGAVYLDEPAPADGLLGNHLTAVKGRHPWACSTTASPQVAPTSRRLRVCTSTAIQQRHGSGDVSLIVKAWIEMSWLRSCDGVLLKYLLPLLQGTEVTVITLSFIADL